MTKQMLNQYYDLKQELEEVKGRINKLKEQINKIECEGNVIDTVTGGDGGIQHYKIEGFPQAEYSRKKTLLQTRIMIQENLQHKINDMTLEVEDYIADIEDSHIRRIITLRFVDNKTWGEIANIMYGKNSTEDSVRMTFNRFFEKNNKNSDFVRNVR